MVMNKKGFLRILEATIAVMIILGAILVISGGRQPEAKVDITETLAPYLDEVAHDSGLRASVIRDYCTSCDNGEIIDGDNQDILYEIEDFIEQRINNPNLKIEIRICEYNLPCPILPYPVEAEELFAVERVVTTNVVEKKGDYSPKKIKLFAYRRQAG